MTSTARAPRSPPHPAWPLHRMETEGSRHSNHFQLTVAGATRLTRSACPMRESELPTLALAHPQAKVGLCGILNNILCHGEGRT